MRKYTMSVDGEMVKEDIMPMLDEINYCEFCNKGKFRITFRSSNYISKKNITYINIEINDYGKNIDEALIEMINCEFCYDSFNISMEKKLKDKDIEKMWYELEDITSLENNEGEYILNSNWFLFDKGTEINEIWEWFNNNHSKGLKYLANEIDS